MHCYLPIQTFTGLACLLFVYLCMNYTTLIVFDNCQEKKLLKDHFMSWKIQVSACKQETSPEMIYNCRKILSIYFHELALSHIFRYCISLLWNVSIIIEKIYRTYGCHSWECVCIDTASWDFVLVGYDCEFICSYDFD